LYESGAASLALGAISGGDMTPSAALVKLMQGLAYHRDLETLTRFVQTPVAGELTVQQPGAPSPPAPLPRRRR
jgi:L-asparaginase